jgi:O-antigen ligase
MTQIRLIARLNQIITRPLTTAPGVYQASGTILGVLGLGVLAAALYLAPKPATLGLVLLGLGFPIVFLLWRRPEFGLLALIFLTGSFIPANIVDVRFPIAGGLDLRDMTLIGLFGFVFLRELARGTLTVPWWSVGGPLLLFLILVVFSTFYALFFEHVESNWALGDLRILSLYTTFYITLWSIKRPVQLKMLLLGLFIIADLTTVIVYIQQFFGAGNPILQAMIMTRDWRVYQETGGVRVVPAGQVLMHFMWFVALGVLVFARPNRRLRAFGVMQFLFIGGGHLLTYMRAQWAAAIIGLGLAIIILVPRYKQHLAKAVFIVSGIVLLSVVMISSGMLSEVSATPFVAGISNRFGSLFAPIEIAESGSLKWRDFEIEKALQAINKHPLTGLGLGNRYRNLTTYQGEALGWLTQGSIATGRVSRFTRYVHNSYVSIAVKMGIPGLIALLWFCAAALFKGFQAYREMPDSEYKGVVLGILVAFAGLFAWCYYHAHLIKAESTGTIGLMVALVGTIAYMQRHGSVSRPNQDHSLPAKGQA